MFHTVEEQDSSLISFYKKDNVNWAAPFKCKLTGDAAVSKGVNRHVVSMTMEKLKTGFTINLGSAPLTTLFEGEKEHRVPSAVAVLQQSNLFQMAGRMIGHSFLHSGFGFSGVSLPVVTLLTSGSTDTATSALTLQDCPDLDHRETIVFVLKRVKQPIRQIRKGLKETGIWPLLSARPDVHHIIFPRESTEELNPQLVMEHIQWPQPNYDSDDDDDDRIPLEKVSLVTGFLRKFIQEASQEDLRNLVRF
ncbi:uncharacterized protein LOC144463730 [Epinephelus lanceolatus]